MFAFCRSVRSPTVELSRVHSSTWINVAPGLMICRGTTRQRVGWLGAAGTAGGRGGQSGGKTQRPAPADAFSEAHTKSLERGSCFPFFKNCFFRKNPAAHRDEGGLEQLVAVEGKVPDKPVERAAAHAVPVVADQQPVALGARGRGLACGAVWSGFPVSTCCSPAPCGNARRVGASTCCSPVPAAMHGRVAVSMCCSPAHRGNAWQGGAARVGLGDGQRRTSMHARQCCGRQLLG